MKDMNSNQVINLLLNRENEISNKFHNTITEILRIGYETEKVLVRLGATVVCGVRNYSLAEENKKPEIGY